MYVQTERSSGSKMDSARSGGAIEEQNSDEDLSPDALVRQNYELRHRLEEETASYKRRLDTYRQAQQHQAALVSRLQAKASIVDLLFSLNIDSLATSK